MNSLVKAQLKQIEQAVAALGEVLAERGSEIHRLQDARDALQREVWSRSKEVAVHREAAADYDALQEANVRYREKHALLEEHLRRVLAYTRALTEQVRQ